jgi:hypothetical protein
MTFPYTQHKDQKIMTLSIFPNIPSWARERIRIDHTKDQNIDTIFILRLCYLQTLLVTKDNFKFTWRRTLMRERWTIMSISKRGRTRMLKELREARSPTRLWTIVMVPATQLIRSKCLTPALAPRNMTVTAQ